MRSPFRLNPLKQVKSFGRAVEGQVGRRLLGLNPLKQVKSFGPRSEGLVLLAVNGVLIP